MPLIPVTSIDDPRLAPYQRLNTRNLTRHSGLFIAEGPKLVDRLIASHFELASLFAEPAYAERYQPRVHPDVPIFTAPGELLEATIGFNFHRGILACGRRQPRTSIGPLLAQLAADRQTIVICPEIQDPTNLGSLIRTAAALGCDCLVLGPHCADPFSRRVLRVSMGTALYLPIIESADLQSDIQTLLASEYELIAAVLDPSAESLPKASRQERLALLLGNEAHGLANEWLNLAHRRVTISMHETIDSLNLTIAAAILLYHFTRD